MARIKLNAQQQRERLRLLTLRDNPPPDPDLQGVAAPKSTLQAAEAPPAQTPPVRAALKKDRVKRNRRKAGIITSFQDRERKRRRG